MADGFNPVGVWSPNNRGFSMGVVAHEGRTIHFTGQVAWDKNENIVGPGDVSAQTHQCFRNILAILSAVGGQIEDIVTITTYYTHYSQLPAIQQVRTKYLAAGSEPVSTSIMVAGLGHEDFLVELTPIAVVPHARFIQPN